MIALLALGLLEGQLPSSVVGRFEINRTSLRQIVSSCGSTKRALRREVGDSGAVYLLTRLSNGGCVAWASGALGGWETLTSVTVFDASAPLCREAERCSLEDLHLTKAINDCSFARLNGTSNELDAGVITRSSLEERHVENRVESTLRGIEAQLFRTGAHSGKCRQLKYFALTEVWISPSQSDAGR